MFLMCGRAALQSSGVFDCTVTEVSNMQWENQDLRTTSTDPGISIVAKPLEANADSSIRGSFEFDSNITDVSDVYSSKPVLAKTEIDIHDSTKVIRNE
jgi:hypothetical protein